MNDASTATDGTQQQCSGSASQTAPRWIDRLFAPIPIAAIVYFRLAFGAIMVWEIGRYFAFGWIRSHYLTDRFQFKYYGFEWVQPWPGNWLYVHFALVGLAAAAMTLGAAYRLAAITFFLGFTYIYLLDQIFYLNHLYLVCLLSFLSIFMPAHRALSIDARLRPRLRATQAPAWTLLLLRFQIAVVYIYGGIAKLNLDWLRGEPIRSWLLSRRAVWPFLETIFHAEVTVWIICYGGLLLDLLVVPMLLWRRTRGLAVAGLIIFHFSNAFLFRIGIFPWLMLAVTPLFFPLDWWSRMNDEMLRFERDRLAPLGLAPRVSPGGQYAAVSPEQSASLRVAGTRRPLIAVLIGAYVLLQILVPLRHLLYPGSVHWTEEGHRFSWRMKLRAKRAHVVEFHARDPDRGLEWRIPTRPYLPPAELRSAATRPDMVLQLAHQMARDLRRQGHTNVQIYARILVQLNDHPVQHLIDPNVDLARQPRTLRHADWIMPLRRRDASGTPASRPPQSEEVEGF